MLNFPLDSVETAAWPVIELITHRDDGEGSAGWELKREDHQTTDFMVGFNQRCQWLVALVDEMIVLDLVDSLKSGFEVGPRRVLTDSFRLENADVELASRSGDGWLNQLGGQTPRRIGRVDGQHGDIQHPLDSVLLEEIDVVGQGFQEDNIH